MRRSDEGGFTLIELTAAMSMLAVGFFALASAMGLGLRQVALGRQRQAATEIANARLEHLRNLPYEAAALSSQPVHSADPDDADYFVSADGNAYDVNGHGSNEPLLIDSSNGQVLHFEDPVTVGSTQMKVYQYVTWVDDTAITGTQDYKRISIVVTFKRPSIGGIAQYVRASAFVTTGSVIVGGSDASANVGASGSPTPTPSPTPTSGSCSTDATAPSGDFTIVSVTGSETGYTASPSVTLGVAVSDGCGPVTASFSNDGVNFGSTVSLPTSAENVGWSLTSGDGAKSVWGRFADGMGNSKTTGPYAIVLDQTPPGAPGTLTHTRACPGNDRTVNLSWGSSTDTNLRGYRVYRSINNGAWAAVATSSSTSASDTHLKTLDSVAFKVVGYDKAGNESNDSNTITLSKNQC